MSPIHRENIGNIIGGHKANIANPHTSDEAKERSKEVLEELGTETKSGSGSKMTADGHVNTQGKNLGNVVGGYKATVNNPRVSDEAKEHAKEALEDLGAKPDDM